MIHNEVQRNTQIFASRSILLYVIVFSALLVLAGGVLVSGALEAAPSAQPLSFANAESALLPPSSDNFLVVPTLDGRVCPVGCDAANFAIFPGAAGGFTVVLIDSTANGVRTMNFSGAQAGEAGVIYSTTDQGGLVVSSDGAGTCTAVGITWSEQHPFSVSFPCG